MFEIENRRVQPIQSVLTNIEVSKSGSYSRMLNEEMKCKDIPPIPGTNLHAYVNPKYRGKPNFKFYYEKRYCSFDLDTCEPIDTIDKIPRYIKSQLGVINEWHKENYDKLKELYKNSRTSG